MNAFTILLILALVASVGLWRCEYLRSCRLARENAFLDKCLSQQEADNRSLSADNVKLRNELVAAAYPVRAELTAKVPALDSTITMNEMPVCFLMEITKDGDN